MHIPFHPTTHDKYQVSFFLDLCQRPQNGATMTFSYLFLLVLTVVVVLSQEVIYTTNSSTHVYTESDGKHFQATLSTIVSSADAKRKCPYKQGDVDADLHIMFNDKDSRPGVIVRICPLEDTLERGGSQSVTMLKAKPTTPLQIPSSANEPLKIAMCIPALFYSRSKYSDSKSWDHTWLWAEKFLEYYHKIGVEQFFLYTLGPRSELNTKVPHTWIDVSWVPDVDKGRKKKKGMWYYGQYWTVNDCLYRNKALGTDWAIFQDYDEIFVSSKYDSLEMMVRDVGNQAVFPENGEDVLPDTIMFGNFVGHMRPCSSKDLKEEDWPSCNRFYRDDIPECRGKLDPFMCTSWKGRRKHVDRVSTVYLTKVHKVLACKDKNCGETNLHARDVWLDHYRGEPYNSSTLHCLCKH